MSECGDLAISEYPICRKPFIKFLFKRIYGLKEDVVWRIPRWLFSTWPSLMCERGDFRYFWVSILLEVFHQVSDKENISLEEDVGWRIPRWLLSAWPSLLWEMGWYAISEKPLCQKPSSFCAREYMVCKEMVVEEFKDGCLVHGHLWWV